MSVSENRRSTIVVVDDDAPMRALVRSVLTKDRRFDVVAEAPDGVDALLAVEEHDPDLLLLDVGLPRLDGVGVLERLDHRERPIVAVMTGILTDGLEEQVRAAGAADFIVKDTTLDIADRLSELVVASGTRPDA